MTTQLLSQREAGSMARARIALADQLSAERDSRLRGNRPDQSGEWDHVQGVKMAEPALPVVALTVDGQAVVAAHNASVATARAGMVKAQSDQQAMILASEKASLRLAGSAGRKARKGQPKAEKQGARPELPEKTGSVYCLYGLEGLVSSLSERAARRAGNAIVNGKRVTGDGLSSWEQSYVKFADAAFLGESVAGAWKGFQTKTVTINETSQTEAILAARSAVLVRVARFTRLYRGAPLDLVKADRKWRLIAWRAAFNELTGLPCGLKGRRDAGARAAASVVSIDSLPASRSALAELETISGEDGFTLRFDPTVADAPSTVGLTAFPDGLCTVVEWNGLRHVPVALRHNGFATGCERSTISQLDPQFESVSERAHGARSESAEILNACQLIWRKCGGKIGASDFDVRPVKRTGAQSTARKSAHKSARLLIALVRGVSPVVAFEKSGLKYSKCALNRILALAGVDCDGLAGQFGLTS